MGGSIQVSPALSIRQPTVGEIRAYGSERYYQMASTLCRIPSDIKSELDQIGKCYMDISDFELFFLLTREMTKAETSLLLGDLDLSKMEPGIRESNGDLVLVDNEHDLVIDRMLYTKLVTGIRQMHGFEYKPEYATNKYTLRALIEEDKFKKERMKATQQDTVSSMLAIMIISLVCSEEFKYNSQTVQSIGICELTLSYRQIINKKNAMALLQGSYSGMVDISKIDKSNLSWIFDGKNLLKSDGSK